MKKAKSGFAECVPVVVGTISVMSEFTCPLFWCIQVWTSYILAIWKSAESVCSSLCHSRCQNCNSLIVACPRNRICKLQNSIVHMSYSRVWPHVSDPSYTALASFRLPHSVQNYYSYFKSLSLWNHPAVCSVSPAPLVCQCAVPSSLICSSQVF